MLIGNVAAFALLVAAFAVSGAPGAAVPAVDRGVVDVDTNLGYQNVAAAGTGMVLSSAGEILTNNHVIRGATTIHVTVPATNRSYAATVVGYDVSADVAVLKLRGASGLQTVALGNSGTLTRGQTVTAVGNAGGAGGAPTDHEGNDHRTEPDDHGERRGRPGRTADRPDRDQRRAPARATRAARC